MFKTACSHFIIDPAECQELAAHGCSYPSGHAAGAPATDPACARGVYTALMNLYLRRINLYNMYAECKTKNDDRGQSTPVRFFDDVIAFTNISSGTRAYRRLTTMLDMTPWMADLLPPEDQLYSTDLLTNLMSIE